jgi:8-oxo-dGTP diphosphatase
MTLAAQKTTTLCYLVRPGEVLLARKKRGFGAGKLNGVGGKVNAGEQLAQGAKREIAEELGVVAEELELGAVVDYWYPAVSAALGWDQRCYVFLVRSWSGVPRESEEVSPRWFPVSAIPYDRMWADDPHWLAQMLAGRKLRASFWFRADLSVERFSLADLKETDTACERVAVD